MAIQKNQSKITQNILLGCTPNIGSQFHSLLIFGEWGEISVKHQLNISEWREAPKHASTFAVTVSDPDSGAWAQWPFTAATSQLPRPQSWTKVSAHNFECTGAVSRKNHLENSSFTWFVSGSVYYWVLLKYHRSPAWVLHPSAPQVGGGLGSREGICI